MNDHDSTTIVIVNQVQFLITSGVPDRSLMPTTTPRMNTHDDGTLGMGRTRVSHHRGLVAGSAHD
eukprot:scaffold152046_cov55-Attheya_sp.AAC.3